jgi:GcrA cell cycle regulator
MRADLWSEERVAALKLLWTAGASARTIAERLGGVSRSAVLGKIFRLRRVAAASALLAAVPKRKLGRPRRRGKSLPELKNDSCRWPYGRPGKASFFFCGEPGADLERGMPYCARHARRAYRRGENIAEATTTPATSFGHKAQTIKSRRAAPGAARPSAPPTRDANERIDGRSLAR